MHAEIAFQTITSYTAVGRVPDAHRFLFKQSGRISWYFSFFPHKRPWNDSPERWHVAVCSNRYLDVDRFRVCSTPKRLKKRLSILGHRSSSSWQVLFHRRSTVSSRSNLPLKPWTSWFGEIETGGGMRGGGQMLARVREGWTFFSLFSSRLEVGVIEETTLLSESSGEHVVQCSSLRFGENWELKKR